MTAFGKEVTLTEVCGAVTYGYTASATENDTGVKFLRITDIVPDRISWENVPFCPISDKDADKYQLHIGDIVVARTGATTGWNKTIKSLSHKAVYASFLIKYSVNLAIADPYYVGYNLQSPNWYDYVDAIAGGSAQPGANAKQLGSFKLLLPPLPEQKAIASVLSSLDDKIDLLHRQNKTLETMAETLFRQWFIEEAKEDWEDGILGDIASNIRVNATTEAIDPNEVYIGLEHIERRHIALSQHGYGSDVSSNKSRFKKHDILFGKLRPYFHKVCITQFDGICSTDILVLRAKERDWIAFTLFAFFQDSVVEYANLASGGTRMPRADWGYLSQYPIAIPPLDLVHEFNEVVIPSIEKIHKNLEQIQTLEQLRDTLLPKLMSGEVRVQYQTEEVA